MKTEETSFNEGHMATEENKMSFMGETDFTASTK